VNQLGWRGSITVEPSNRRRQLARKAKAVSSNTKLGGSWIRTGPSLSPSPPISSKNRARGSSESASRRSWVTVFGAFTAKAKPSGVEAAQRS
jgi:hypothetical protein